MGNCGPSFWGLSLNIQYPVMDQNCWVTIFLVSVVILVIQNNEGIQNIYTFTKKPRGWLACGIKHDVQSLSPLVHIWQGEVKNVPAGQLSGVPFVTVTCRWTSALWTTAHPQASGQVCSWKRGSDTTEAQHRGLSLPPGLAPWAQMKACGQEAVEE